MVYFESEVEVPGINMEERKHWIRFRLTNDNDYVIFSGSEDHIYTFKVSKHQCHYWMDVLGDFLQYEKCLGRKLILDLKREEFKFARECYRGRKYNERLVRAYEPNILVHSTTWDSWENIKADGCLKSWNQLKKENPNFEKEPIGTCLGDPENYRDYIMFSGGHFSGEIVVLSKLSGFINMDIHESYQSGARLYFDLKTIAEDGLLVRDGAHLKVKDTLPLEKYLLWVGTWDKIGLKSQTSTPLEFTIEANRIFNKLFNERLPITFE